MGGVCRWISTKLNMFDVTIKQADPISILADDDVHWRINLTDDKPPMS